MDTCDLKSFENYKSNPLSYGYGEYGFAFCILSDKDEQATALGSCRAWLSDVYFYHFHNQNRFEPTDYNAKEIKVSTKNVRLAARYSLINKETWILIQDFLNKLEEYLGISEKTVISHCEKYNCYRIVGDKIWIHSPILLSMYVLLIRNIKNNHSVDSTWDKTIRKMANDFESEFSYESSKILINSINRMSKYGILNLFYKNREINYRLESLYSNHHDFGCSSFFSKGRYADSNFNKNVRYFFRNIKKNNEQKEMVIVD